MPSDNVLEIDTLLTSDQKAESVRIGLIADTHIPGNVKILPPHVREAFKGIDLILHAGDIYQPAVLDELDRIAPVLAARGNGDGGFPVDNRLNDKHVLSIAGTSLGIIHTLDDFPLPEHYGEMVEGKFGRRVDVVVFGDTHVPMVERYNSTLLVNPGSPALPRNLYQLGTVGLLEIKAGTARARIVQLSDFPLPLKRELIYY